MEMIKRDSPIGIYAPYQIYQIQTILLKVLKMWRLWIELFLLWEESERMEEVRRQLGREEEEEEWRKLGIGGMDKVRIGER